MYIKKIWDCGNVREVEKIHSHRFNSKKFTRDTKHKKTSLAVQKQNHKNSFKKLRRLINANFGPSDYLISLTYDNYHKTTDKDQSRKDMDKILRKIRDAFHKRGSQAKYIARTEIGKTKRSYHHHIVLKSEDIPIGLIASFWENGGINFTPLYKYEKSLGDYSALASYLLKEDYAQEEYPEDEKVYKKKWNSSKNLIIPEPKIEIVKADSWREDPVIPKGYMLVPDSLSVGVSEVTGYPYQYYRCVRIPGAKISPKGKTYKNKKVVA